MSISAVGGGSGYNPPVQSPQGRPAAQAPTPAKVSTDSDGDHDGDKGSKGQTVDVKA